MSDLQSSKISLHLERRRKIQSQDLSQKSGSSPYFTRSRETTMVKDDEADTAEQKAPRQRQAMLAFSNGRLVNKKPLVNPVSRKDARRKLLAEVAAETWELLPGLLATRLDVGAEGYLCQKENLDSRRRPNLPQVKVAVVDCDTIDAALSIQRATSSARPVAILNMANANTPGGGWKHGALAQEEALCYRTSLIRTLHKKYYPIPDDAAIYSPRIMIIRENIKNGHDLLDFSDPKQLEVISAISCAAVCQPFLRKDAQGRPTYKDDKDRALMLEKMRIVLRTSIRNRHWRLVLGAFGCGAFGNPNWEVASMWASVLQEPEFQAGYWECVTFAVLDDARGDNFQVFFNKLDGLTV